MAERKTPAGAADFVAKIVKDPKNPPATLLLTGFLGASSEEGHTRLYFDAALSNYVEIPNDAILHTAPAGEDGLGASYVWIKRDAMLVYGPAGAQRPKGTFLEGPIMQQHVAAAAGAGGGTGQRENTYWPCTVFHCAPDYYHHYNQMERQAAPVGQPRSDFVPCQSWVCPPSLNCPKSDFVPCQSWICPPTPNCPRSDFVPCQSWICPPTPNCPRSDFVPCQSWICPPTHAHCPPTPPMLCMTVHCTVPPQCPVLSAPPHCPTVGPCPSIACQSAVCQAGGFAAAGAAPAAAAAPASVICATVIACPTLPVNCGTLPPSIHGVACPSWAPPCPTPHYACPTQPRLCLSVLFHCPPHTVVCEAKP